MTKLKFTGGLSSSSDNNAAMIVFGPDGYYPTTSAISWAAA